MPDTRTAHAERTPRTLLWVQRVLVWSGAVLLVAAGLAVADAWMAQARARRTFATMRVPAVASPWQSGVDTVPVVRPDDAVHAIVPLALASLATGVVAPPPEAPIGELTIPRIDLAAMVLSGDDARTLRRGPGHIPGTALPGEPGTVAIAGHRDSFFRPIRHIRLGDDIFLDTPRGRFAYRVSSLRIVGPNDVSVLRSGDAAGTLTLITCYPFSLAGPAPERFIVMATEVVRPEG